MKVDEKLLRELEGKARTLDRRRTNFNFHTDSSDPMQRMLNVLQSDSYVRAHKHENPDKREAFIILKGRLLIALFNSHGKITDSVVLDRNEGVYVFEVPPATYHTIVALEDNTVVYELKDGPYDPADDKDFASWAPDEAEKEDARLFMDTLKRQLKV